MAPRTVKRRRERGAAVVEAVLVTPLFLSLILGIIELGPLFLDWNGVHSATREGARTASVSGSSPDADYDVLHDARDRLKSAVGRVEWIIVFKATTVDDDPPAACVTSADSGGRGVSGSCNVYRVADFTRPVDDFGTGTAGAPDENWPAPSRKDYLDGPPDFVGVSVKVRHFSLSGVIPKVNLRTTNVFQIEPTASSGG